MLSSFVFQPTLNKEGSQVQTPSHPPPSIPAAVAPAEQRSRNSSPVQKPRDSPPPSPPLSPPSRCTESEVESLLVEPQTGLPGDTQFSKNSFIRYHFNCHKDCTFLFLSSCRFGSCADRRYCSWRRIISQRFGSEDFNPPLCPSLLLLSGPSHPGRPKADARHRCYTQVKKWTHWIWISCSVKSTETAADFTESITGCFSGKISWCTNIQNTDH